MHGQFIYTYEFERGALTAEAIESNGEGPKYRLNNASEKAACVGWAVGYNKQYTTDRSTSLSLKNICEAGWFGWGLGYSA